MKFTPRRLLSGLAALATLATLAGATSELRAERPRVYAITDATVVVSPGRQIDRATVVVRDGLIETVSTLREPPADAEVISGEGLWVYSGLIDLRSMLELNPTEERNENAPRPRVQPTDSGVPVQSASIER